MQSSTDIIKYFKNLNLDLPLHVLRQFQEFNKSVDVAMESYDRLPEFVAYGMKCFTQIEILSLALMSEKYPVVERCHTEIMKLFGEDVAFSDGVSVPFWILFNFPHLPGKETIAEIVLNNFHPEPAKYFTPFVTAAVSSRLGLYEVINDGSKTCHLRELVTGAKVKLDQSLGGVSRGTVELLRVVIIDGKTIIFGNSQEFPADKKDYLLNMIKAKMSIYYPNSDPVKSYEIMMRLAGPYWFSIAAKDYTGDILNPDFQHKYYLARQENKI